jgi:hypothetical protein
LKKATRKIIWVSIGSFFAGIIFCLLVIVLIVHFFILLPQKRQQAEKSIHNLALLRLANPYDDKIAEDAPQFNYQSEIGRAHV